MICITPKLVTYECISFSECAEVLYIDVHYFGIMVASHNRISYLNIWYVSASVILWTLIYCFVLSRNSKQSELWNCRIVAIIHSLTITKLIELSFLLEANPFYNIGEQNSNLQNLAMILSGGYFLFDFAWCLIKGNEGMLMLLHHMISIFSLIGGLYLNHSGAEICTTLWGSELTNPFLQIRWFLKEVKQYDSAFGRLTDFIFFWIFAFSRIGIGSGLAYLFYHAKKTILIIKVGGFLFYGLSIIWMWQICLFIRHKYFKKRTH